MARKKKEGHHGGAWKVAFADFMTAMMALFMVLWICAQDQKIVIATARYFQNPFNSPLEKSSGIMEFNASTPNKGSGKEEGKSPDSTPASDAKTIDLQFLNSVAKD